MDEDYETRMQHNQLMRRNKQGRKDDARRRLRLQQHLKDLRELRRIRLEREAGGAATSANGATATPAGTTPGSGAP